MDELDFGFDDVVEDDLPFTGDDSVGTCPNCGSPVFYGKYGAYCSDRCGATIAKAFKHMFTRTEIANLLKGEKTLITGLISKKGKPYDAYLTPKGLEDYEFVREDGSTFSGKRFKFEMDFPERD